MPTATMTSKGQITMPKVVRDELGLIAGSKVMFVKMPDGRYSLIPRTGRISDVFGAVPVESSLSLEEMDAIVRDGAVESDQRTRNI
ncbi:AbrB/MazE/SpoVT family DNA-binding domain-containing protein [Microbacterium sp.]|uniref:AbrB/MazE/SpoVT family DNA-binding domain-containing protein n=1 Tax=Microbacterium sp. TaxID=51671 RepID=UPI003562A715